METHTNRKRPNGSETTALVSLLVLSAFPFQKLSRIFAQGTLDHPFIETKDLKSDTCLTCHATKKAAKFVHTAVGMGCENCHQAASKNNETTITLVADGGDLCARCHAATNGRVLHQPYQAGRCLICHDPHSGGYSGQIRAQVNVLCLGCYGTAQPDVKVNKYNKLAILPGGQTVSLEEYGRARKIDGRHSESHRSQNALGPVAVKAPGQSGTETTCLSCHDPHTSQAQHLLRSAVDTLGEFEDRAFSTGPRTTRVLRRAQDDSLKALLSSHISQNATAPQSSSRGGRA
jgi:predicted CXXCH cytochrome family protein